MLNMAYPNGYFPNVRSILSSNEVRFVSFSEAVPFHCTVVVQTL